MPNRLALQDPLPIAIAEPLLGLPLILAAAVLLAVVAALLTVLQVGRALLPVPIRRPSRRPLSRAADSPAHPSHP